MAIGTARAIGIQAIVIPEDSGITTLPEVVVPDVTQQPGGWLPIKYMDRNGKEISIDAAPAKIIEDIAIQPATKKAQARVSKRIKDLLSKVRDYRNTGALDARTDKYLEDAEGRIQAVQLAARQSEFKQTRKRIRDAKEAERAAIEAAYVESTIQIIQDNNAKAIELLMDIERQAEDQYNQLMETLRMLIAELRAELDEILSNSKIAEVWVRHAKKQQSE